MNLKISHLIDNISNCNCFDDYEPYVEFKKFKPTKFTVEDISKFKVRLPTFPNEIEALKGLDQWHYRVLNYVYKLLNMHPDKAKKKKHVFISMDSFQGLLNNKDDDIVKEIIIELCNRKIIRRKIRYQKKRRAYGYDMAQWYIDLLKSDKCKWVDFDKYPRAEPNKNKLLEKNLKAIDESNFKVYTDVDGDFISTSKSEYHEFITRKVNEKLKRLDFDKDIKQFLDINHPFYDKYDEAGKNMMLNRLREFIRIVTLKTPLKVTVCKQGRIFHALSNMPKEWSYHLLIDGEKPLHIDQATTFPTHALQLFVKHKIRECEIYKWKEWLCNDFYEMIADSSGKTRDQAKQVVSKWFCGGTVEWFDETIQKEFPDIHQFFTTKRGKYWSRFNRKYEDIEFSETIGLKCMRSEARVFVDHMEEWGDKNDVFIWSKHDCIMCLPKDLEKVAHQLDVKCKTTKNKKIFHLARFSITYDGKELYKGVLRDLDVFKNDLNVKEKKMPKMDRGDNLEIDFFQTDVNIKDMQSGEKDKEVKSDLKSIDAYKSEIINDPDPDPDPDEDNPLLNEIDCLIGDLGLSDDDDPDPVPITKRVGSTWLYSKFKFGNRYNNSERYYDS